MRIDIEVNGAANGAILGETDTEYHIRLFDGSEMWCPKSDASVTPCLIRDFYWESWITAWFLREVEEHDNFIDVGANSGYYSALAANKGLTVYAFEPNPSYTSLLNKIPGVTVFPVGLSDAVGRQTLYIPDDLEGSATLRPILDGHDVTAFDVDISTLDTVFDEPLAGNTLIKVDAEGLEQHILRGAKSMDAVWMLEYTPGAYDSYFLTDLTRDYSLSWINHSGGEESVTAAEVIAFGDWLMLVLRSKNG